MSETDEVGLQIVDRQWALQPMYARLVDVVTRRPLRCDDMTIRQGVGESYLEVTATFYVHKVYGPTGAEVTAPMDGGSGA